MGIESDKLVFDYLSRVGDLAQQQQLSSGDRMRLVTQLRSEIEAQRAGSADSAASVKRILGKLGTPSDVVAAAGGTDGRPEAPRHRPAAQAADSGSGARKATSEQAGSKRSGARNPGARKPGARKPGARNPGARKPGARKPGARNPGAEKQSANRGPLGTGPFGLRLGGRNVDNGEAAAAETGDRQAGEPDAPAAERSAPLTGRILDKSTTVPPPRSPNEPSPPHLAGEDELGPQEATPDWWRIEPGPFGDVGEAVPGFVGGIEVPEILKPPPAPEVDAERLRKAEAEAAAKAAEEAQPAGAGAGAGRGAGLARRLLFRHRREVVRRSFSPLLLLAAGLLVAGAVLGSLILLGVGWLIAYGTRALTRAENKWAALGLPGLVAAGALVWLWGRFDGRWGEPIAKGQMSAALTETWPVALRAAAVVSALYLLWRARRR
ncbi:hypothetical protein [Streptomyces sp. NPDC051776]|uniref:hypothetical protein n=1 Tax=Streptomyces sp. NPDC051776 TaxID=3155414 RepID=UPI003424D066